MSNTWIEITIKTTTEAVEAITNILYENGAQGAMIDDPKDFFFQKAHEYDWDYAEEDVFKRSDGDDSVYIKTYVSEEKNIVEFIDAVKSRIQLLKDYLDIGDGGVYTAKVNEEDWANNWKKYYKPFKIGDRILIKPEWEDVNAEDGDIVIEMNPGMAFGTGNHETTSMCIENIERYLTKDSVVYDIGCGSGILGITAAMLGSKSVLGIDIDEVAVKVANENIIKNGVESKMTAIKGNLADEIDEDKKADIIVANIIADIIIFLSSDIKKYLKEDGYFISSGIILDKVEDVVSALEKNGFKVEDVQKRGEWACIISK